MKIPLTSTRWNISWLYSEVTLSNVPPSCTMREFRRGHDLPLRRIIDIGHKQCVGLGSETHDEPMTLSNISYTHYNVQEKRKGGKGEHHR